MKPLIGIAENQTQLAGVLGEMKFHIAIFPNAGLSTTAGGGADLLRVAEGPSDTPRRVAQPDRAELARAEKIPHRNGYC
jgi:hypothetical protein